MIDGQGGLKVQVSLPVTQIQTRLVDCSPQELDMQQSANPHNPELWKCPKRVTTTTTQMQTTTANVKSDEMSGWRADPAPDDKWNVHAEYTVQSQHHTASWLVDRQSLSIGPQNDK